MESNSKNRSVGPFVEHVEPMDPLVHKNLTLIPLAGGQQSKLDYLLASEAIEAGTLIVTEVSKEGSVGELSVTNTVGKLVLILDGEELIGAKQNRIMNTSILILPLVKVIIPVSCVEQGRWMHTSENFVRGGYAPVCLRSPKSAAVSRNLRARGEARSDQGEVWDAVDYCSAALHSPSPTRAMRDVFDQQEGELNEYLKALAYPGGTRGVIVGINGRFAALDIVDTPRTLAILWDRLVHSYAIDALITDSESKEEFSMDRAKELLGSLALMSGEVFPSVGYGEECRFESTEIVGQALVADDVCVHMSVFPGRHRGSSCDRRSSVLPPSQRKRRF